MQGRGDRSMVMRKEWSLSLMVKGKATSQVPNGHDLSQGKIKGFKELENPVLCRMSSNHT